MTARAGSRRLKFVLIVLAVFAATAGTAWWQRAPLLRGVAGWWIVSDAPTQADAIVILGGGLDSRPFDAAKLFREGHAPRILVMQPEPTKVNELGLLIDYATLTRTLLERENVPASAIVVLPQTVTSTFDEAEALAAWAKENNAHRFLTPTELFHTRRARWILRRRLQETGADVSMIAINPKRYTAANWWQTEQGLIDFQNEAVKFAWYFFRY
ncbi:MAG TPA: ElyC/SanA/YdcF family protein [Blastocatellia bacterium]|nr:ElyC/SanA/YdcF family protein [Blastocatellia bacterium]HMV85704.1 ElyC/SanA/YdcF family protein [Blastocatellia bacterium]HMX24204.1 ElyC/SanA/YdcF family protein [Blastocatellia bacterium]HMZ16421.1 ElyC/SanA/YdcF family protein [Blastocatellia bacterium]HNG31543.1 ElyC/SanA/YdcF family protein [Blastocatellia bacterium]